MPRKKTTFAKGLLDDAIHYITTHGGQFVDDIAGSIVDPDVLKLINKYTEGYTPAQLSTMLDNLKASDSQLFEDNHILEVMREMAHSAKPLAFKSPPKGKIPTPSMDDLRMYNNMDFSDLLPPNVDAYLSNYVPKLQNAYDKAKNVYGKTQNAVGNAYGNVRNSAVGNAIASEPVVSLFLAALAAGGLGYGLSTDDQKRKVKTSINDAYIRGKIASNNGFRTFDNTLRNTIESNEILHPLASLANNINNARHNSMNTLNSMGNIISDSYTSGKQGKKPKTDYMGDKLINAIGGTVSGLENAFGKRLSKKDSVMYKHADGKPNPIKYGSPYKNKFEK